MSARCGDRSQDNQARGLSEDGGRRSFHSAKGSASGRALQNEGKEIRGRPRPAAQPGHR